MPTKIAVIGAGISGVCAAMSAAQKGANVTLIEKSQFVGGVATRTNVGTFCGAYIVKNNEPVLVGSTQTKNFLREIMVLGNIKKPIEHTRDLYIIPYHFDALQHFLETKIKLFGIAFCPDTVITSIACEDHKITAITMLRNGVENTSYFDAVIDCTGNAVVARHINHPVIENRIYQSASRVFYMKNVYAQSEKSLRLYLSLAQQRVQNSTLRKKLLLCSIVPGSYQNNQIGIKVNLPWDVKEISVNLSFYLAQSYVLIQEIAAWLSQDVEAFSKAQILKVFDDIGFRSSARTLGQKVLTKKDLQRPPSGESFAAIGTWPVEKWGFDGNVTIEMKDIAKTGYGIAKECLISAQVPNLFMAGKNISADEDAIASARVMGTCIQTGFAAGALATKVNLKSLA